MNIYIYIYILYISVLVLLHMIGAAHIQKSNNISVVKLSGECYCSCDRSFIILSDQVISCQIKSNKIRPSKMRFFEERVISSKMENNKTSWAVPFGCFWVPSGYLLGTFWVPSGTFWAPFEYLLGTFWVPSGYLLGPPARPASRCCPAPGWGAWGEAAAHGMVCHVCHIYIYI